MKQLGEVLSDLCSKGMKWCDELIDTHENAMEQEETDKAMGSEGTHHIAFHRSAIRAHKKMKANFSNAMEMCEKAQRDDDLAKTPRDGVQGINWGVNRLIPRAGSPGSEEFGKSMAAKPDVPVELQHILGDDDVQADV